MYENERIVIINKLNFIRDMKSTSLDFIRAFKKISFIKFFVLVPLFVTAQDYQLVWSDEFTDGMSADWTYDIGGHGWGNNELQYYTNTNTSVTDGTLKIIVKKEIMGSNNYTSSRIKTKGAQAWKYGRIEARIKLSEVQGNFPAFWMLGTSFNGSNWPECGEIDIMEQINTEDFIHSNVHYDNNGHSSNNKSLNCNVTEFHVYGIDWDEESIRFLLDGQQYHEVNILNGINGTDEFHKEHFILLNYAMGGNWPGFEVDETALPATMEVDYVRVYQKAESTSITSIHNKGISCYPNPVNEVLNIEFNETVNTSFEIFSITGIKVYSQQVSNINKVSMNLNQLDAGLYYLVNKDFGYCNKLIVTK